MNRHRTERRSWERLDEWARVFGFIRGPREESRSQDRSGAMKKRWMPPGDRRAPQPDARTGGIFAMPPAVVR